MARSLIVLTACLFMSPVLAEAQDVSTPPAAAGNSQAAPTVNPLDVVPIGGCMLPPAKLGQGEIDAFLANPDQALAFSKDHLDSQAYRLVGSDISTLKSFLAVNAKATSDQKGTLAGALARVARMCAPHRPDITTYIQLEIERNAENELLTAFLAITDFLETAAVRGAGPQSAGPGAAGIGDTGGGPATLGPSIYTPQSGPSFSFSGGGGSQIASLRSTSGGSQSPIRP
ncbi:hypothetical protein IZ6_26530 [Terrihabitans soli]|uniref:Uncharacterized protein n=1 Tax=Terrihabitans soli TaxID=708113 RepID=A0A6S6QZ65_9HYPH|nr:hypothetical protein [Terrihabitans soli]BCJ91918.1 hypothetical protein IZ6_26530 [Terrihabitans soli]